MRYKATLSYDGSKFIGWQKQITGLSVQEDIERCLSVMNKKEMHIIGSGRTDKGVHAINQVFHFDSDLKIDPDKYAYAINRQTSKGLYIKKLEVVCDNFHSRKDVLRKTYEYKINLGKYDVFKRNYELQLNEPLVIDKIIEASKYLIGTHDYSSFNANTFKETPNQIRTIFDIMVNVENNLLTIQFCGSGFLRYMVRMMTQTLIEVGKETISPLIVKELLEAKDKTLVSYKAKPEGLYLKDIVYKGEDNEEN